MYMGSKKCPYEGGGGDIKFKKKSHKSSHNNFRKKVKKIRVGWLTIFFKDKGGRLTPPPPVRVHFKPGRNFYSYVDPGSP